MAQLYYRYSTMNAGKSTELIKVAYNYEERGKRVLTLVPGVDNRYGGGMVTSRMGIQRKATIVNEDTNILELFMDEHMREPIDCVLIDECQFLKRHHVEELVEIVDSCDVPVLAYGLKMTLGTNFLRVLTICWFTLTKSKKLKPFAGADEKLPW